MRALLFFWCVGLSGCMGLSDYYLADPVAYEYVGAEYCPCQTSGVTSASPRVVPLNPGVVPATAQIPAPPQPQTREPDLLPPSR